MTEDAGKVGVYEVPQDEGDLPSEYRVQQLDDEDKTETEHEEGEDEQDDPEHVVAPRVGDVLEHEVTCGQTHGGHTMRKGQTDITMVVSTSRRTVGYIIGRKIWQKER